MPVLEDLREQRKAVYSELETLGKVDKPTAEQNSRWSELDGQIEEIDKQIELRARQAERETRAAADRAARDGGQGGDITDGSVKPSGFKVGSEPMVYGRMSGHSIFLDAARLKCSQGDGDGGLDAAYSRMIRHQEELDVEMPKREERRMAAAQKAYDEALTPREKRMVQRLVDDGGTPFERRERRRSPDREKRFISRVDGAGGYFVPPLWLIDQYIPYLRAGRDFINLCRELPLPPGTDSINIPRVTLGAATGPQVTDGGPVPGRDMTDNFVTAPVKTIAGQQDAALQLLDQSPVMFDEIIFQDLAADYNMQLDGQALVGSGTAGQLTGIWPAGSIAAANQVYVSNQTTNTSAQGQTWVATGTGGNSQNTIHVSSAQLLSQISRNRLMTPTHWLWNPWMWYMLASTVDGQSRPIVVPGTPNNTGFNQAAVDTDGPEVMGPVGYYYGLPVVLDPNVPTTFANPADTGNFSSQPQMSTISAGQFAPVAGVGTNAKYTPLLAGRFDDVFLWEGEMRSRVLSEVLSGNLQVRFQAYNYVAFLPNRYQSYGTPGQSISYGSVFTGDSSHYNPLLNIATTGF